MQFPPPLALEPPQGGGLAAPGQMVVPSYPAPITAQAPPTTQTVTTADAMATEGRIIEDAAMHEQYVRVITPMPAPTEETEEVGLSAGWQAFGPGPALAMHWPCGLSRRFPVLEFVCRCSGCVLCLLLHLACDAWKLGFKDSREGEEDQWHGG